MATGVEIVSTISKSLTTPILSASTFESESDTQLNSTTKFDSALFYNVIVKQHSRSSPFISGDFYKFLNTLSQHDMNAIISAVGKIYTFQFVKNMKFENRNTPTLKIQISELNREYEDKIYEIEYNLLRNINTFIDFYIKPF